ncbi:MAG: hypothetical protein P8Y70_10990 [Candidatus Lokiarchaeota archaeon]
MAKYGSTMSALEATEMGARVGLPRSFNDLKEFIQNNSIKQDKSTIN